jgi:hypothetical protein
VSSFAIHSGVFVDDDGTEYHGAEGTARWLAHMDKVREHNERALAQLKPHELAKLETWLLTRTSDTPPHRPPSRPSTGRAPRPATNARQRGSKRSSARRSSERSGDSGEDGPEPPPAPRECEWCGERIDHLNADARYCGTKHRVYAARARDRANPDRVAARAIENGTAGRPRPCRCSPQGHLVDDGLCFHCGRARGAVSTAWMREARDLKVRDLALRSPARRDPRTGDGKRRPRRVYVDESIIRQVAA